MIAEASAADIAALIESGGTGILVVVVIALWRIGTGIKSAVDSAKETFASVRETAGNAKEAVEEWQRSSKAHFAVEEKLLRELKDELERRRKQDETQAEVRQEMMRLRARVDRLNAKAESHAAEAQG